MNTNSADHDHQGQTQKKIRIVCISDTHNQRPGEGFSLPQGDVLIHAGDLTKQGTVRELEKAALWLREAEFGIKIVVGGNHDLTLDPTSPQTTPQDHSRNLNLLSSIPNLTYLDHTSIPLTTPSNPSNPLKVFASPASPLDLGRSGRYTAFQYPTTQATEIWSHIPTSTDILVTHTPPFGHRDESNHWSGGCPALLDALARARPVLHVSGHCHAGRGVEVIRWRDRPSPLNEDGKTEGCEDGEAQVESIHPWQDPGAGNKKLSLLDLTGRKGGGRVERGRETAVVNASMQAGDGGWNKALVVDLPVE